MAAHLHAAPCDQFIKENVNKMLTEGAKIKCGEVLDSIQYYLSDSICPLKCN